MPVASRSFFTRAHTRIVFPDPSTSFNDTSSVSGWPKCASNRSFDHFFYSPGRQFCFRNWTRRLVRRKASIPTSSFPPADLHFTLPCSSSGKFRLLIMLLVNIIRACSSHLCHRCTTFIKSTFIKSCCRWRGCVRGEAFEGTFIQSAIWRIILSFPPVLSFLRRWQVLLFTLTPDLKLPKKI